MTLHWPSKNFWYRTLFGIAFTAVTALIIGISHLPFCGWIFASGVALIQLVALTEYVQLAKGKGFAPAAPLLYLLGSAYIFLHYLSITIPLFSLLPALALLIGTLVGSCGSFGNQNNALANFALTVFGFAYITLPLSWLLDINFLASSPVGTPSFFWIVWLLVVTKGGDMAAYFSGKVLGKHSLAPFISPKKTIEGAIFGIMGSAFFGAILAIAWAGESRAIASFAMLGALVGLVGIAGDLFESLLKRDVGVKDSNAIPGLGGILDIVDSLLFAIPLLLLYLMLTGQMV
jgi:phosphatidate cytidylyltransferase